MSIKKTVRKTKGGNAYMDSIPRERGRPILLINENGKKMIEVLAGFFCTDEDIADTLETTTDTLTNRNNREVFSECKRKGIAKGKVSLRRKQFILADKSAAMAIFLGKNYLDQRDIPLNEIEAGEGNVVLNLNFAKPKPKPEDEDGEGEADGGSSGS